MATSASTSDPASVSRCAGVRQQGEAAADDPAGDLHAEHGQRQPKGDQQAAPALLASAVMVVAVAVVCVAVRHASPGRYSTVVVDEAQPPAAVTELRADGPRWRATHGHHEVSTNGRGRSLRPLRPAGRSVWRSDGGPRRPGVSMEPRPDVIAVDARPLV